MQYQHGGDVYSYSEQFPGTTPLDFSSNINPRGIPARVRAAMHDAIDLCTQYPDPHCRALRKALGQRWQLDPKYFFCANGAAEIFYRLAACLKPSRALLTAPTFGEYEMALRPTGCDIDFFTLSASEQFRVTARILDQITDDLSLLILCNPNNPTGCTIDPQLLVQIIERCRAHQTWLILDECFGDFLLDAHAHEMRPWLDQYDRLIIVRAFTKMYAVPGVRLGWCMTKNLDLISELSTSGQPWNVSVIAQACGVAALACTDWEGQTASEIAKSRQKLFSALSDCGFQVFPGEANYLLFYSDCYDLREQLMPHGVLIRSCANYRGLGQGYYRVAVKSDADNQILIQTISEVLTHGS